MASPTEPGEGINEARFRFFTVRLLIASIGLFAPVFFLYLVYCIWTEKAWTLTILQEHFAGIVSVPLACIGALCVVLVLRSTEGPMEFEGLGFKFKGAAGPVVLWAMCFIVIVLGIRVLW
jgi:hypothetical protein